MLKVVLRPYGGGSDAASAAAVDDDNHIYVWK